MRTKDEHEKQCKEVEDDHTNSKSKEYGINHTSILNDLSHFHTSTGALLPDIMHDVLEGGLQYEMKLMLKQFVCEDKYFTIHDLRYRIENFGFGYTDVKNRPSPITMATLTNGDNSLKQNGKLTFVVIFFWDSYSLVPRPSLFFVLRGLGVRKYVMFRYPGPAWVCPWRHLLSP